jgi:hypothetical protein
MKHSRAAALLRDLRDDETSAGPAVIESHMNGIIDLLVPVIFALLGRVILVWNTRGSVR